MLMTSVRSSNIVAIGYKDGTLRVQFSNGTEYDYKGEGVNAELFNSFMNAESAGKFFHQNIKGKLSGTKVEREEEDGG